MVAILFLVALSPTAAAFPHLAPVDPPLAETLGDPGRLSVEAGFSHDGNLFWMAAAAGQRVDLVAGLADNGHVVFGLRALVLDDLGPLRAVLELGTDGLSFAAGVLLGPVRLDAARTFAGAIRRSATATVSFTDRLAFVVGGEEKARVWSPLLCLRFLGPSGIWWASAWIRGGSMELRMGAML